MAAKSNASRRSEVILVHYEFAKRIWGVGHKEDSKPAEVPTEHAWTVRTECRGTQRTIPGPPITRPPDGQGDA